MSIGPAFREARERAGMSQRDLALAAGVSTSFLSKLENDQANPTWARLEQVAAALASAPRLHLVADPSSVARTAADIAQLSPTERLYHQPIDVFASLDILAQAGKAGLEYAVTGDVAGLLQGLPTPLRSMHVLVLDDDATLLVHEEMLLGTGLLFREVGPEGLREWPERTWALGDADVTIRLVDALPLTTTVEISQFGLRPCGVRVVALTELLEDPTLPDLSGG